MAGVSCDDFQLDSFALKKHILNNSPTNKYFAGASRTARCANQWTDDVTTCGSKLDEFAEIKGDEVPLERKSHCLVLLWGNAKMGARGHLQVDSRFSSKYVCIMEMTDHLSSY